MPNILNSIFSSPFNSGDGGSTRAFDEDALLWKSAVEAGGGSVSLSRLIIADQFFFSEKESGAWALTDDYWCFWAESATQALVSLKQRRTATMVNSPTFTTDRDFTMDGATSYIDTGFIPGTHGINITGNDQRLATYQRINATAAGQAAGASNGAAGFPKLVLNPRTGNNMNGLLGTASAFPAVFALSPVDSRGLKAISRAGGGTTGLGYDRGVRLTDVTGMTVYNGAITRALYIGCYNNAGVAAGFRAASIGFAIIGGPLSDAQELAQYNAVQAWATSVGANV